MRFLKRRFHQTDKSSPGRRTDQAVLIHLDGSCLPDEVYEQCDLSTLEDRILAALADTGQGDYDGNEMGPAETTLYLYGPDAERLFMRVEPVLAGCPLDRNARVVIRKGGPGAPQREVRIAAA